MHSLLLKPKFFITLIATLFSYCTLLNAQCTRISTCGYTVTVNVSPISIVPSSTSCPFGYNYNVQFRYTITASGTNTCSSGTLGVQPQIFCNSGQNNGYYTINTAIPNGAVSVTNSGTLTTTTNPYRSLTDCATATPTSLGCNSMQITMFGPGISTITFTCGFSTLPIELAYFYAIPLENGVKFNWSTFSEKNNDFFTLEKSHDAENWSIVKHLMGQGNSTRKTDYHLFDNTNLKGITYYRLKQTDYDGSYNYSDIVVVNPESEDAYLEVNLFPNPFNSEVTVTTSNTNKKEVRLLSSAGDLLQHFNFFDNTKLEVTDYPSGMYILEVIEGDQKSHHKIFKQ